MQSEIRAKIETTLANQLDIQPGLCKIDNHPGGLSHSNFRVTTPDRELFVRVSNPDAEYCGADIQTDYLCSEIMGFAGVSPRVLYFSVDSRIMITEFIHGETLSEETTLTEENISRIIDGLRRLRETPSFPSLVSPFKMIDSALGYSTSLGVVHFDELESGKPLINELRSILELPQNKMFPTHHDLNPRNIIVTTSQTFIVDWEYAGMGDPIFDLAHLYNRTCPSDEFSKALLSEYLDKPTDVDLARYELWRVVSSYWCALWYCVQTRISKLSFNFDAAARRFTQLYISRAKHEDLANWMRLVAKTHIGIGTPITERP